MEKVSAAVILAASLLGGMETAYAYQAWKGSREHFYQVWNERIFYAGTAVWLAFLAFTWHLGMARLWVLISTYVLLAAVDLRWKIIPDSVLLCYLAAQLLLGAASQDAGELFRCLAEGLAFALILMAVSWLLRGKLGMGDAKLLGVTAMTAGWQYTIQVMIYAFAVSFVAGVWLLVFRKMSVKTEMPFVPFLTLGMALQLFVLIYF